MRDSKVVLPVTETKEAAIAELVELVEYYGIESDDGCIIDTQAKGAASCETFGDCIYAMDLEYVANKYASMKAKTYIQMMLDGKAKTTLKNESVAIRFQQRWWCI